MHNSDRKFILRQAVNSDQQAIWKILQDAILRRKEDGSDQWQNGYPNEETVLEDIEKKYGFVLEVEGKIAAYTALIFEIEPAYETETVKWLSDGDYAVVHRVAISKDFIKQGIATKLFSEMEDFVRSKGIQSIKVDTKYDNIPMLKIFEKLEYQYCGEVYFRGSARKAFEKLLI